MSAKEHFTANSNPDNLEMKKNHWRQRVRLILEALGLESLLSSRLKKMVETYIPKEDTVPLSQERVPTQASAPAAKIPELSLIDSLLEKLNQAVKQALTKAKQTAQQKLQQAQSNGTISQPTAQIIDNVINKIYSEEHLETVTKKALQQEPVVSEEELASYDEQEREEMQAYQTTLSSNAATPIERVKAANNLCMNQVLRQQANQTKVDSIELNTARTVLIHTNNISIEDLFLEITKVIDDPQYSDINKHSIFNSNYSSIFQMVNSNKKERDNTDYQVIKFSIN